MQRRYARMATGLLSEFTNPYALQSPQRMDAILQARSKLELAWHELTDEIKADVRKGDVLIAAKIGDVMNLFTHTGHLEENRAKYGPDHWWWFGSIPAAMTR